ncbi:MAG: hypothetical protein HFG39_12060 [Lachnospiraceae bacterium]|nr:hypothetical protein [Lachnospiraceae bacterium]
MKRNLDMIKGIIEKEDFHIHPRPDYSDERIISTYVNELTKIGVFDIGFVEHGVRKSSKHQSVLYNEQIINDYSRKIKNIDKSKDINIWAGIEVDYYGCEEFAKEYMDMVNASNLEFVIGSVHGKYVDYNAYLEDTIAMLENYKIDILGHFKMCDDIWQYNNVGKVIKLLCEKQVFFEVNIAPRYDAPLLVKEYVYSLLRSNNVRISVGSDAHSIDDIHKNYTNLAWMDIIQKQ